MGLYLQPFMDMCNLATLLRQAQVITLMEKGSLTVDLYLADTATDAFWGGPHLLVFSSPICLTPANLAAMAREISHSFLRSKGYTGVVPAASEIEEAGSCSLATRGELLFANILLSIQLSVQESADERPCWPSPLQIPPTPRHVRGGKGCHRSLRLV